MIDPSLSPQVSTSSYGLNWQQVTLAFSLRFCCRLAVIFDFTSRSLGSRNSFVFMNSISYIFKVPSSP